MAFAFKTPQAKPTFGEFKEPLDAGEYILKKKASTTFCKPYKCPGKPRISSQGDYILLNAAKNNINDRLSLSFNKANLYINLLTTLDLKGCCTVQTNPSSSNCDINIPIQTIETGPFYINYTIDPNGCLFGNTLCDANNYLRMLRYSKQQLRTNNNNDNNNDDGFVEALNSDKIIFGDETEN